MGTLNLWTIGHSNRTLEQFLELLDSQRIQLLADVRRFPGSRRLPHFNQENLSKSLAAAGIEYVHFPELGGRRKATANSPNTVWRNEAFRAYADFMMTEEFRGGIARLLEFAGQKRTAIMCAEALWWQCHRSLIADYLKAEGNKVFHIMSENKADEHPFTSAARIVDGKLSYSAESEPQFLF
ncbi:MAG TPA: DUF488 domain-containing protein [Verrucomicrobiae bacterium]|jgi:uncharacterized protein (DUF488 family)|nr:DUF488 domain-containing protein [Verrucomicrobiae bacterium]